MLDYAANAVVYWPVGHIRETVEDTCASNGIDWLICPTEFLTADSSDDPAPIDTFWEAVDTNLHADKIRLVFVADSIPRQLRRIVEFLNTRMNPTEVLPLEIKQPLFWTAFIGSLETKMRAEGSHDATARPINQLPSGAQTSAAKPPLAAAGDRTRHPVEGAARNPASHKLFSLAAGARLLAALLNAAGEGGEEHVEGGEDEALLVTGQGVQQGCSLFLQLRYSF